MTTQRKIISIRRHCEPGKDPETGASLDYLTTKGKLQAVEIGIGLMDKYGTDGLLVIGARNSDTHRAYQTAKGILYGSDNNLLNPATNQLLNPMGFTEELLNNALITPEGQKRSADEVVQYLIDHNDERSEPVDIVGSRIAHQVQIICQAMECAGYHDNITHGPVIDIALLKILGLNKVAEIGGCFKPGENFEFVVDYNPRSDSIVGVTLEYRDQRVELGNDYLE